jgi:hypothetical protein
MADETPSTIEEGNDPGKPTSVVCTMQLNWNMTETLMGGTKAARAAGQKYLPKNKMEEPEDYKVRVERSTLLPAFKETIKKMTGRVFAQPLKLGATIPKVMWNPADESGILDDVDLQGRSIHVFAREVFESAVEKGHAFILCEAPIKGADIQTQEQEQQAKLRAYFIHVEAPRMLGWLRDDSMRLTQCRISFEREQTVGKYGTACVQQVRVYEQAVADGPVTVETFELQKNQNNGKEEWASVSKVITGFKRIPIICVYTNRTDFFQSEPPLLECAFLNMQHWQEKSGLDNLMAVVKVPILTYNGDTSDGKMLVIGASYITKLPIGSELKYCEHTGAAIQSGENQLKRIEQEIRDAGGKLLQPQASRSSGSSGSSSSGGGSKTATQVTEEAAADNSALGMMVEDFEDSLEDALDLMAEIMGEQDGGDVECQPNLDPDTSPIETITTLISMANAGKLSAKTLFEEAQRRGLLSSDLDWETEQTQIQEELTAMGLNMPARKPAPNAPGADPGAPGAPAPAPTPLPGTKKPGTGLSP